MESDLFIGSDMKIKEQRLRQARLKELLHYDPETGIFTWRVSTSNRVKAGTHAGSLGVRGYISICVEGFVHKAHRLAWLYVHGVWPNNDIDHKDRDRSNNRILNLRDATRKENSENSGGRSDNTSGYRGVCLFQRDSKWQAQIMHNGDLLYLGRFNTPEEASTAYEEARNKLFTHHKKAT